MYTNTMVLMLRWPHLRGAVRLLSRSNSSKVKANAPVLNAKDSNLKNNDVLSDIQTETNKPEKIKSSLIEAAFAPLKSRTSIRVNTIEDAIHRATNPEQLLELVDKCRLNRKQALKIVSILAEWSATGETEMKVFERDPRFTALCQNLGRPYTPSSLKTAKEGTSDDLTMVLNVKNDDEAAKIVTTFSLPQTIKVLSSLSYKKRRSVPLLRSLSFSIVQSTAKLDLKEGADILYSLASLNYLDEVLLEKVCGELYEKIPSCKKSPIIGSISTSLGILKYKDVDLLDNICEWTIRNIEICRNQDLSSILLTLAHVNYKPSDTEGFFKEVRKRLLEFDVSVSRAEVVWALTVLEQAKKEDYASVLQGKYHDTIRTAFPEGIPHSLKKKLLNINGAAKSTADYSGPLLPVTEDFETVTARSKDKQVLVTSVFEAMSNLLPSSVYLKTNVDLKMGFNLDGECLLDNKMTPLPLVDRNTGKPLENNNGIKIAIMIWDYHEHTKGQVGLCGVPALCQSLARSAGYRILSISYHNFNAKEKLITRVKYLEKQLKALVNPS